MMQIFENITNKRITHGIEERGSVRSDYKPKFSLFFERAKKRERGESWMQQKGSVGAFSKRTRKKDTEGREKFSQKNNKIVIFCNRPPDIQYFERVYFQKLFYLMIEERYFCFSRCCLPLQKRRLVEALLCKRKKKVAQGCMHKCNMFEVRDASSYRVDVKLSMGN
jgi:hypothetical protein